LIIVNLLYADGNFYSIILGNTTLKEIVVRVIIAITQKK